MFEFGASHNDLENSVRRFVDTRRTLQACHDPAIVPAGCLPVGSAPAATEAFAAIGPHSPYWSPECSAHEMSPQPDWISESVEAQRRLVHRLKLSRRSAGSLTSEKFLRLRSRQCCWRVVRA